MYIYIYTHRHTHIYIYTYAYTYTYATYIYIYTQINIYTYYIHIYIYIYIHYMQINMSHISGKDRPPAFCSPHLASWQYLIISSSLRGASKKVMSAPASTKAKHLSISVKTYRETMGNTWKANLSPLISSGKLTANWRIGMFNRQIGKFMDVQFLWWFTEG